MNVFAVISVTLNLLNDCIHEFAASPDKKRRSNQRKKTSELRQSNLSHNLFLLFNFYFSFVCICIRNFARIENERRAAMRSRFKKENKNAFIGAFLAVSCRESKKEAETIVVSFDFGRKRKTK